MSLGALRLHLRIPLVPVRQAYRHVRQSQDEERHVIRGDPDREPRHPQDEEDAVIGFLLRFTFTAVQRYGCT